MNLKYNLDNEICFVLQSFCFRMLVKIIQQCPMSVRKNIEMLMSKNVKFLRTWKDDWYVMLENVSME